jgi:hypothetical protein
MMIRKIAAGCCIWAVSLTVSAQGAFNFDEISGFNEEPIVVININSLAIGLARTLLGQADPATADLLEGLRGIQLRVYHAENNSRQINSFIADATEELEDAGWQSILAVRNEEANVRIHMQMTESHVSGLTLMAFDGAEAVFLNIDGTVSAADLGRVMAAFNQGDVFSGMPLPAMPPAPAVID